MSEEISDTEAIPFDPESFLKQLTRRPGIYQMIDGSGQVLYVGKAKNLKNRVSSYFRARGLNNKTLALVAKIHRIDITVTNSETEALLLEHNLIKQHRPPYNILLRDDKSFPYIFLSDDEYPRLAFHRGAKKKKGEYFGPYPSSGAVRESLNFLQKVFKVRQCEDSFFKNRSRPCLQYQIKRCHAPCVELEDEEIYAEAVHHTRMFLQGKNKDLLNELADGMEKAAEELEFEKAALFRDQIRYLQRIQEDQCIEGELGDVDIVAAAVKAGMACVHLLYVRGGRILGSKSYYPSYRLDDSEEELVSAFIAQFYLAKPASEIPSVIVTGRELNDAEPLEEALSERASKAVSISSKVRSSRAQWLKLAETAAQQNLNNHLAGKQKIQQRFEDLQRELSLAEMPQRLECFDISHSSGEKTVASCVVFDSNGPVKSDYRRFNIEDITPGDDYAAMAQALFRRYKRIKSGEGKMPDILLIDGGKGQVAQAEHVIEELALQGVLLIGVAKGSSRKPGMETLIVEGREMALAGDSGALHLIQHIRDEAHRFAVTGHKQRRDKSRRTSVLEGINGVGAKRRKELLRHFGGLQGVMRASVNELRKVPGINEKLAQHIYASLHNE